MPDIVLLPHAEVTRTSLTLAPSLSFDDFKKHMATLGRIGSGHMWWIGDSLHQAEPKYGETYKDAVDGTGLALKTCADAKSVSKKVESSIRIENLSWHHHKLIAPLPHREQKTWLNRAEKNGWTVAELRKELRAAADRDAMEDNAEGTATATLSSWQDWHEAQDPCDLLLTDPPYATDVEDITAFAAWLPVLLEKVKPTGRAYVCVGAYPNELAAYLNQPELSHIPLRQVLVWTYRNTLGPSPKHNYKLNWQAILYFCGVEAPPLSCPIMTEQFSVQDINAPDGRQGDRHHAWQKPMDLAERFVRHGSSEGELVLDPFCGTGTFLLAAKKLGRHGIGCDADKEMLAIAGSRGVDVE